MLASKLACMQARLDVGLLHPVIILGLLRRDTNRWSCVCHHGTGGCCACMLCSSGLMGWNGKLRCDSWAGELDSNSNSLDLGRREYAEQGLYDVFKDYVFMDYVFTSYDFTFVTTSSLLLPLLPPNGL